MVHSKLVLYLLVTRAILHCQSESLETKVDRLSDRLNLLDSKVSLDLVALRQDLEEVRQLVATSDKGGEVRCCFLVMWHIQNTVVFQIKCYNLVQ